MALNIHQKLGDSENDYTHYYTKTTEMKKLTLPNEMGEKFKVMVLSRDYSHDVSGLDLINQLHLL